MTSAEHKGTELKEWHLEVEMSHPLLNLINSLADTSTSLSFPSVQNVLPVSSASPPPPTVCNRPTHPLAVPCECHINWDGAVKFCYCKYRVKIKKYCVRTKKYSVWIRENNWWTCFHIFNGSNRTFTHLLLNLSGWSWCLNTAIITRNVSQQSLFFLEV